MNRGEMPYMDNPVFPQNKKEEEPKPVLTLGNIINNKPEKILQDDLTLMQTMQ